jgi:hypothetical protein
MIKYLLAATLALAAVIPAHARVDDEPLPECNSDYTIKWLMRTYEQAQFARVSGSTISGVIIAGEYEGDGDQTGVRHCTALVYVNNGSRAVVDYKIERRQMMASSQKFWMSIYSNGYIPPPRP